LSSTIKCITIVTYLSLIMHMVYEKLFEIMIKGFSEVLNGSGDGLQSEHLPAIYVPILMSNIIHTHHF
jgi:hypothetical protein